jgi:hypothetical protein
MGGSNMKLYSRKISLALIVFGLIYLINPSKVLAEDGTLMYLDCTYNISYGADNIDGKYTDIYSNNLHIAYTEILDEDLKGYKIKVTDAGGTFYNNLNENLNEHTKVKIVETDNTKSTFTSAYVANNNSCPKYMTVEHSSGSKYTTLFSNELTGVCSGTTPGTQCKMIYNFSKTDYKVYFN